MKILAVLMFACAVCATIIITKRILLYGTNQRSDAFESGFDLGMELCKETRDVGDISIERKQYYLDKWNMAVDKEDVK